MITKTKYLSIIYALLFILFSCKKEAVESEVNMDHLILELQPLNIPIHEYKRGATNILITSSDSKIYYANLPSGNQEQFFLEYDPEKSALKSLPTTINMRTGGYQGGLVTNGRYVYYFGKEGNRFDLNTNTWGPANYPDALKRHGKTTTFANNLIFHIGGTNNTLKVNYYEPDNDNWYQSNDAIIDLEYSTALGTANELFVKSHDNKSFAAYHFINKNWVKKADSPIKFNVWSDRNLMVEWKNRYILLLENGTQIYIYDTHKDEWTPEPIRLNVPKQVNISLANIVRCDHKIYYVSCTSDGYFIAYELTFKTK